MSEGERVYKGATTGELEKWARSGDTKAMNNLANALYASDPERALRWYRESADAGDLAAMSNYGVVLYRRGETDEAGRWLRQASDQGNLRAMRYLARLPSTSPEESRRLLETATAKGDLRAQGEFALAIREAEPARARALLEDAAGKDDAWSKVSLAKWPGVPEERRVELLEEACELGLSKAYDALGVLRLAQSAPRREVLSLFEEAARLGSYMGTYRLSQMTEVSDPSRAVPYLTTLAERGDDDATYMLGRHLVQLGDSMADHWFARAAEMGNASSMAIVGYDLKRSDPDKALEWLFRAADLGDSLGALHLASLLHDLGRQEEADLWYLRAAFRGEKVAKRVVPFRFLWASRPRKKAMIENYRQLRAQQPAQGRKT